MPLKLIAQRQAIVTSEAQKDLADDPTWQPWHVSWGWRRLSSKKLTILMVSVLWGAGIQCWPFTPSVKRLSIFFPHQRFWDTDFAEDLMPKMGWFMTKSNLTKIGRLLIQAPWQKLISKGDMALTIPFNMRTLNPQCDIRMQKSVDDLWLNEWIKVQTTFWADIRVVDGNNGIYDIYGRWKRLQIVFTAGLRCASPHLALLVPPWNTSTDFIEEKNNVATTIVNHPQFHHK